MGFVLPTPVVQRAMRVYSVVAGAGWDAAMELCTATFRGWEVEFLGAALGMLRAADDDMELVNQSRIFAQVIGGGRG